MTGGKMQLTAVGAQDLYLTGNPQITFFKAVYRRHTNFAIDTQEVTFNTTPSVNANNSTATLSYIGDLISKVWIEARFEQGNDTNYNYINWTNNTGAAYIEECYVKIGPHEIDRHTSTWFDVYNELTDHDNSEHFGLNKHVAKKTYLRSNSNKLPKLDLNIPLQFWFNRNPGMALPICALTQSEVKLHFKFRAINTLINKSANLGGPITLKDPIVKLYADYVYLSSEEKRRFTHKPLEYLIETLQVLPDKILQNNVKLEFSHPVKELIWIMNNTNRLTSTDALAEGVTVDASLNSAISKVNDTFQDGNQSNDYFNYLPGSVNTSTINNKIKDLGQYAGSNITEWFDIVTLKLNGSERSPKRNPYYYRHVQPLQAKHKVPYKHIYLYSFALTPEEYSPSGTCNFTHVSSAELLFTTINGIDQNEANTNSKRITIFAVTYNILRISSGRGGIAYSN
jgi:hypothetical protein